MKNNFLQVNIDKDRIVLSSTSLFYKTENFLDKAKYVSNLDRLLSKICEGIVLNLGELKDKNGTKDTDCYYVETIDKVYSFRFKLGYQVNTELNENDVVFFDYIENKNNSSYRIDEYLNSNTLSVILKRDSRIIKPEEFNKLYLICNISNINLPRLNPIQKEIVEIIDKNVLVQGVAGSGKTNICIDKIIFTACRNFSGKVLYTTFSRGLLTDTKLKVEAYKKDLEFILTALKNNKIKFLDNNHKKAFENRLGIYFFSDDSDDIIAKIEKVLFYLTNKVDYLLIEDLYNKEFKEKPIFVGQDYFINTYSNNLSNYQIEKCFNKLNKYSKEIIYKEIFGFIFGSYFENSDIITKEQYISARSNSFEKTECESIYMIAVDFKKHCESNNLLDNNLASLKLIGEFKINRDKEYSLSIIDEVQDYTQVNLYLFKLLSLKMFCVGDALQMINPSYFSFANLKNLLFEKDVTDVKELTHNYRNSAKIEQIVNELSKINKEEFGTHNFVLNSDSVDSGVPTKAIYVNDYDFVNKISSSKLDNFTIVVNDEKKKKNLRKIIKNQEVLTVSDIKGLERPTVVLVDILSSNIDKWKTLEHRKINHKTADENSVYRYFYNLFYVGITRARQNIFVLEQNKVNQFEKFFKDNFEQMDSRTAIKLLEDIVSIVEFTQDDALSRVNEFIRLGQFDNARFMAGKLKNDVTRINALRKIEVYENFVKFGKYREAGIKFWEFGLITDAKNQFTLSGDKILIELIDKCVENNKNDLSIDILDYFEDVKDNSIAREFILDTVRKDIKEFKNSFNLINENFKKGRK